MLVSWTPTGPRRWRLFLVDFFVRMWRLKAWPRLTVPPGRTRKRFFAPLLVFILGIECSVCLVLVRRRGVVPRLDGPEPLVVASFEFATFLASLSTRHRRLRRGADTS